MAFYEPVNAPYGVFVVEVDGAEGRMVFGFHLQQTLPFTRWGVALKRLLGEPIESLEGRCVLGMGKVVEGLLDFFFRGPRGGVDGGAACQTVGLGVCRSGQQECREGDRKEEARR